MIGVKWNNNKQELGIKHLKNLDKNAAWQGSNLLSHLMSHRNHLLFFLKFVIGFVYGILKDQ